MKHLAKQFLERSIEAETFEAVDNYEEILRNSIPIIDVRSPSEFTQGAVRHAVNLPLLTDEERKLVGIAYKRGGQTSAIATGLELLSNEERDNRIDGWIQFLHEHPDALICCWRGGLRSKIVQTWLRNTGREVPRIVGGSKALRNSCLQLIDAAGQYDYVIVAGRTGTGKTQLVKEIRPSIDLEGLALHRGSAFGGDTAVQPPPISFESALAQDLLRFKQAANILVEDESRVIGKLAIPESLFSKMGRSPVVVLQTEKAVRIQHIYASYVRGTIESEMLANLEKIRRRLGVERYHEIRASLQNAYHTNTYQDHAIWLSQLLQYYYDPMYDYQLARKKERVIFQGSKNAVKEFLTNKLAFESH